jgi:hypothetical protein
MATFHDRPKMITMPAAIVAVYVLVVVLHLMMKPVTCIPTVVTMTNDMDGMLLNVHCHSAEDDLGWHAVNFQSNYIISFEDNFTGTTLFTCDFNAGDPFPTTSIIVFRGFAYGPSMPCYATCTWTVKTSGFFDNGVFNTPWAP